MEGRGVSIGVEVVVGVEENQSERGIVVKVRSRSCDVGLAVDAEWSAFQSRSLRWEANNLKNWVSPWIERTKLASDIGCNEYVIVLRRSSEVTPFGWRRETNS